MSMSFTRFYGNSQPAAFRLFCFPYAGGSSHIYNTWHTHFTQNIEVLPAQLPGRGSRFLEQPHHRMQDLLDEFEQAMLPMLDVPFALFGHSMGAQICFELTRRLLTRGLPPVHLILSGRAAPHKIPASRNTHTLSDEAMIRHLKELDGTPREILENPEILELVLPVFRADSQILETHEFSWPDPLLPVPVTVFGGSEDAAVSQDSLAAWQELFAPPVSQVTMPGDHFYVHNAELMVRALENNCF